MSEFASQRTTPKLELFVDPSRCIGCSACVEACSECPDHGGESMIHLDWVAPGKSVQTAPTVCMHCDEPACAAVCPADAIKVDADGVVLSAAAEKCIGCGNCSMACPFGVPKISPERALMQKCDLCYDRTSVGLKPMCATVCPSGALFYGTAAEIAVLRRSQPRRQFVFGGEVVDTRNAIMTPGGGSLTGLGGSESRGRSSAELQLEEALC